MDYTLRQHTQTWRFGSLIRQVVGGDNDTPTLNVSDAIHQALTYARDQSHGRAIGDFYQFGVLNQRSLQATFNHCQQLGLDEVQLLEFGYNTRQANAISGIPSQRTHIINGFFEQSFAETLRSVYTFREAAIVVFQGISYAPTLAALEWVRPYLADNTVLMFDNLRTHDSHHEVSQQRALHEFLANDSEYSTRVFSEFSNRGSSLVVQKSNR